MPYLAILLTIFLFSTVEVASKALGGNIDPFFLAFIRFFLSGILMLAMSFKSLKKLDKKAYLNFFLLGLLGVTIALGAFHISLHYLKASTGAVIFSINPIFSTLFALFILKEKFSKTNFLGIIIGLLGVYIVSFGFKGVSKESLIGPVLMFISAFSFGAYIVLIKKSIREYGALISTSIVFIMGSLFYLPFIKSFEITNLSSNYGIILYLSVIATGVAYISYFYGLQKVPVIVGSSLFYLKPIIASILSVIILKEALLVNFYIGLLIIFSGLYLSIKKQSAK